MARGFEGSDVTGLPKDVIWVVFEDVSTNDWFVGGTSVTVLREQDKK